MSWAGNGDVHCVTQCGGTHSAVTRGITHVYVCAPWHSMAGHQRTVGIPADGGRADRWAFRRALHHGWAHVIACAVGEGGH
jgi:hypothetical protein